MIVGIYLDCRDDVSGVGKVVIERKTPKMLNDYTLAQPGVDRHNRYRQHLLHFEKRFPANSFSFHIFSTMLGSASPTPSW
mmetsp:Transcript_53135/g.113574  ORF Transcript_53135/g.113574 Transcript_53135/m.113574 type:complete len:80 (-) Transcript_53135:276-515(-)